MAVLSREQEERISLCDVLDRALNKGVVVMGELIISVADVDLIYLGLRVVLTSAETARSAGMLTGSVRTNQEGRQL